MPHRQLRYDHKETQAGAGGIHFATVHWKGRFWSCLKCEVTFPSPHTLLYASRRVFIGIWRERLVTFTVSLATSGGFMLPSSR